ncbi:MAG: L,D-transpeptidase, partial [candidate division KSB1 bacterium]
GEGGKGANWTAGCVALRNDHMDEVYKLAKVGTPVTIVGSLKGLPALEETFQNLRKHTNGHTQH